MLLYDVACECVSLLKLDLYYANFSNLIKDVFLHYSEINQTITKYYFNLLLQDIICVLHIILLFVTV